MTEERVRDRHADPVKHQAQVRAANRARYKAVQILIERYPDEFRSLYAEAGAAEDPPVDPGRRGRDREPIEDKAVRLRLDEVARVYRENINANPVQAVQAELGIRSYKVAKVRVQWARQAGLLPPTTPGRKRA